MMNRYSGHRRLLTIGMIVVAVSLTASGAGNADDTEDGVTHGTGGSAPPSTMSFTDCDIQAGVFEVPAALAAEAVPPGFEPTSILEPDGPTASFVVDPHSCQNATVHPPNAWHSPDGRVEDVGWVAYLLAVDPPEEFKEAGDRNDVTAYWIPAGAVADAEQVVDVFEAWNLSFENGFVGMEETDAMAARRGQLEVRSDSIDSTLHTAVSPEAEGDNASHKGWTFVADDESGEVIGIVEFDVTGDTQFLGGAERIVETAPSDPGEVPFWAAKNPATRGVGAHFDVSSIDVQPRDPEKVTDPGESSQ